MDGMRADRKNLGAGIRKMRSVAKQLMAWAEALHLWENGEKLYLEDELLGEAEIIQRSAMEEDERQGLAPSDEERHHSLHLERRDFCFKQETDSLDLGLE